LSTSPDTSPDVIVKAGTHPEPVPAKHRLLGGWNLDVTI
jgi:hypothetical protein